MQGKWAIYGRLLGYLRPHWREVTVAYVSMLIATVLSLLVPQLVKRAIDTGLSTGNARALFMTGGLILLVAIVAAIALTLRRRSNTKYQDPWDQIAVKRKILYDGLSLKKN